ncbi:hypothetical protein ZWY2020_037958 [Hordeum vulgare]|nr:hypothetical protein ZWY2020_037958 [Hordeum vulgare]
MDTAASPSPSPPCLPFSLSYSHPSPSHLSFFPDLQDTMDGCPRLRRPRLAVLHRISCPATGSVRLGAPSARSTLLHPCSVAAAPRKAAAYAMCLQLRNE